MWCLLRPERLFWYVFGVETSGWCEMEYDGIFPVRWQSVHVGKGPKKQGLYITGVGLVAPIYDMIISDVNWMAINGKHLQQMKMGRLGSATRGNATPADYRRVGRLIGGK